MAKEAPQKWQISTCTQFYNSITQTQHFRETYTTVNLHISAHVFRSRQYQLHIFTKIFVLLKSKHVFNIIFNNKNIYLNKTIYCRNQINYLDLLKTVKFLSLKTVSSDGCKAQIEFSSDSEWLNLSNQELVSRETNFGIKSLIPSLSGAR